MTLPHKKFHYTSYKTSFRSVPAVMLHMEELERELEETELKNLRAFNKTYLIITRNVFAKVGTRYFTNDALMKHVDINFAQYYFDALKRYVVDGKTTPAWQTLFAFCKQNTSYQIIYMAMGVNAHVNNDLGLSLYDTIKKESFQQDFDKVNYIIHTSIPEVLDSLQETSPFINISKQRLAFAYTIFMDRMIRKWRKNAWNNYINRSNGTLTVKHIEEKAHMIAQELSPITNLTQSYKLISLFRN